MGRVTGHTALAVMLAMVLTVSADTIVYDNSVNRVGNMVNVRGGGEGAEFGDGATLDGTERLVTRLSLVFDARDGDHPADVRVRLYKGGDNAANDPAGMLWESELFRQMIILEGSNLYHFDVPSVPVPESVTWTVSFDNIGGSQGAVGPRFTFFDPPPVVGWSQEHIWVRERQGNWIYYSLQFFPNLGARIEAVASCDPCDMNCDGTVDASDIEFFIDLLFNGGEPCGTCTGDTNGDGSIDAEDIEGFINCLFP